MIGILFLILHIIVFVSIGFVLGAIFEWQNTKWNILQEKNILYFRDGHWLCFDVWR